MHSHPQLSEDEIMGLRGKMELKKYATRIKPGPLIDMVNEALPDVAARYGTSPGIFNYYM